MRMYEKISKFVGDHWRGLLLVVGCVVFCAATLLCCKNGIDVSVERNKILIQKVKGRG